MYTCEAEGTESSVFLPIYILPASYIFTELEMNYIKIYKSTNKC